MTAKMIPQRLGKHARYGSCCRSCKKWTYAQTRRQWQRAIKQPCPHCGAPYCYAEAS